MATRQEVRAAMDVYDAKADQRLALREERNAAWDDLQVATSNFEAKQTAYRTAVDEEAAAEDELERLVVEHEPAQLDEPGGQTPSEQPTEPASETPDAT